MWVLYNMESNDTNRAIRSSSFSICNHDYKNVRYTIDYKNILLKNEYLQLRKFIQINIKHLNL